MTVARKRRGMKTQALVAQWFTRHGFPFATDTGAGRPGRDINGMIGICLEVKARSDLSPRAWLKQAKSSAGDDLPAVVFRPNGMGEASIGEWGVLLTLEDFTALVRQAGYGSPFEDAS